MDRRERERGQVVPLMVLVILVAMGAVALLGRAGGMLADHARARSAADAAALAGAAAGRAAAAEVAAANGASLVRFEQGGPATEVRVRVGEAEAVARAERVPTGAEPRRPDG